MSKTIQAARTKRQAIIRLIVARQTVNRFPPGRKSVGSTETGGEEAKEGGEEER